MEATVEPSASQPATAKAAATRKGLAETAIPEVVGALPTRPRRQGCQEGLFPVFRSAGILRSLKVHGLPG